MGRAFSEGRFLAWETSEGTARSWRLRGSRIPRTDVVIYDQDAASDRNKLGTEVDRFPSLGNFFGAIEANGWSIADRDSVDVYRGYAFCVVEPTNIQRNAGGGSR